MKQFIRQHYKALQKFDAYLEKNRDRDELYFLKHVKIREANFKPFHSLYEYYRINQYLKYQKQLRQKHHFKKLIRKCRKH